MLMAKLFSCFALSGKAMTLIAAGAGSVCHMASIAATFIFWFSVAR